MTSNTKFLFDRKDEPDYLGDDWQWSDRIVGKVESGQHKLFIQQNELRFQIKGVSLILRVDDSGKLPILKMVLLTNFPEAISELDGRLRSRTRKI